MPFHKPAMLDFLFSPLYSDFFTADRSYLALNNIYSGWLSKYKFKDDNSQSVINISRKHFASYGIAKELATDG